MGTWGEAAWAAIHDAHLSLVDNVTFQQRKKSIQDAYPFGTRTGWPYKAWLKAQKKYLSRYDDRPVSKMTGSLFSAHTAAN